MSRLAKAKKDKDLTQNVIQLLGIIEQSVSNEHQKNILDKVWGSSLASNRPRESKGFVKELCSILKI